MLDHVAIAEGREEDRTLDQRAGQRRRDVAIEIGNLRVDALARVAAHRGDPLLLTPMEFELLVFLARNPGRAFAREELLRDVWGPDRVGHRHMVAVNIGWLRAKLGESGRMIQTVAGGGYRLAAPSQARS